MQRNKSDYAIALILAGITLGICALKTSDNFRMLDDSAAYISQGIALVTGRTNKFIHDNTLMISNIDVAYLFGPYAYPWGFPLLLAPIYKIFGFNLVAFKSVGIICYALFVGIFYIFCANRLPKIYAVFGSLLFALNPFLTHFATNEILSDIPFLLFGFVALIILARLFADSKTSHSLADGEQRANHTQKAPPLAGGVGVGYSNANGKIDCHDSLRESRNDGISKMGGGRIYAIVGGIFMLFSAMIRINGLVILCALIAMHGILLAKRFAPQIFKTRILTPFAKVDSPYSWKIHAIPYAIFIAGFFIISIALSSGTARHTDYLTMINAQTMLNNLKAINFTWFIGLESGVDSVILWLCVPFIALGIYMPFRTKDAKAINENIFYAIFALGFFALLLLWVAFDRRFLFLLLPFAVFWSFKGVLYVNQKLFSRAVAVLLVFILANLVWINARDISFANSDTNPDNAYNAEARELYKFIIDNTPKDAIFITFKPRVLYLATHRRSFVSPKIERLDEADFVLWNGKYVQDLHTMQDISSPVFVAKTNLIFENAEYKLFKVLK